VDVGIVTWNTRDLTLQALERLAAEDVRVLVRDNGSTDGTAQAIRERFPDVLLDVGDNVGFAAGVNALLALSDRPWFLTLNSDAWPEPGALTQLLAVGEQHPRAAAVAPLLRRPDGLLEPSTHGLPGLLLAAAAGMGLPLGRKRAERLCLPPAWQHDRTREVGWAVGAALLLRRDCLDEIGPLDETFFMYAEDLEWCWRACRAGWQVWFTPEATVWHVGNASGSQRFGDARERVAIANANTVVARYRGRPVAAVWRVLNAAGATRAWWQARRDGDRDRADYWRRLVPAHLGRRE
jgi:GT2 family glycosyltransferase